MIARRPAATSLSRRRQGRLLASSGFAGFGGYEGARSTRSATRNWHPRIGSPDTDAVPDLEPLRSRARDLSRNAPLIAGALETQLTCIVGPGLIPHPRIEAEFLGLSDEAAEKWQKQAARIWWAVAGGTGLDIRRRFNFAQLTWIAFRSYFTDGDHFYRRRYQPRTGDLLGLKLQLIEADRVSNPNRIPDTDRLVEGVEMDADGAISTFHVADRHPGDLITFRPTIWSPQSAFSADTGEALMRQIALIERDGQTRGVTPLASVIEAVKQLTRYGGAELDAAVSTSFISAIFKSDSGFGLPSMGTGTNPPPVGFQGGPASAAASRQIELAPAAVIGLKLDESLEAYNPQRPNSGFDAFFRAWCSIIGVAIGLPHELLIKHFTSSYSASRGALLEAWRGFNTKRSLLVIDQWAQQVYDWVIAEAVARKYLEAPGFFEDPLVHAAYCECQWTGPIMGQLNPLQEIQAADTRVRMTVSTLQEETAQLTGGDSWDRKLEQRAREHKKVQEAGLVEPPTVVNAGVPADASPDVVDLQEQQDAKKGGVE